MRTPMHVGIRTLPLLALLSACSRPGTSRPTTTPAEAATQPTPASPAADSQPPAANDSTTSHDSGAPQGTVTTVNASDDEQRTAAQGINALGAALYGRLRSTPGNLAFSPASIATAFGMTAYGARGATAAEMRRALHHTLPAEAQARALGALSARWNGVTNERLEIHTANRLYGHTRFPFEAAYVTSTRDWFGAPLEEVDFTNANPVRTQINGWVAQQTHDRIRDLIPSGGITSDTRLVLVNAMYFKATWAETFNEIFTRPESFQVNGGAAVPTPTMHRTDSYAVSVRNGFKVLEMPFAEGDYVLDIVLPDAANGLAQLETQIGANTFSEWFEGLRTQRVALSLPKFRVEPSLIRLRSHFEALGMRIAFTNGADFTGIANPPSPDDRLQISEGFHKAFVDVNERGAEAAAATAVVMMRAGAAPMQEQPMEFRVDHPFLFVLRDRTTGAVMFVGRMNDPRASAS